MAVEREVNNVAHVYVVKAEGQAQCRAAESRSGHKLNMQISPTIYNGLKSDIAEELSYYKHYLPCHVKKTAKKYLEYEYHGRPYLHTPY